MMRAGIGAGMGAGDGLCDDEGLARLVATIGADAVAGLAEVERLLVAYPDDARLHFLKGSLLVGAKRFVGAHLALSRAVELAPDFDLARFQLGFFELTSGEAAAAVRTWAPLEQSLAEDHWMRLFVTGLRALAEDRYAACREALTAGIAANRDNAPLNADMALIVAECEKLDGAGEGAAAADDPVSATSLLLGSARRH
ncbi:hypothetical protein [Sphingomonas adhaesiva]|uniref:hypothetical protein n=1 Tax=Sphingomonas adhaesiva TaxID=28212 RepID=UPI002FF6BB5A